MKDREIQLNEKVQDIEKAKDSTKMFKAVQELNRKKFQNPFVHDKKGRKVTNPQEIYSIVNEHFKKQFKVDTEEELEPFDGPPRPLKKKIQVEEVRRSARKLKTTDQQTTKEYQ